MTVPATPPADQLDSPLNVGDLVWLPERIRNATPFGESIAGKPGRIVSIGLDGWTMVDRGQYGAFGVWLSELRKADEDQAPTTGGGAR